VLLCARPDSLIVSVELMESQERILVTAVRDADSTLHLPAEPVYALLGLNRPPVSWITVAALQQQYPSARVVWVPQELRVVILDPGRVFPASRRANQQVLARQQMALGLPSIGGPYASLAWDDRSALLDVGYSYRGRFAAGGLLDNEYGALWHATIAPSRFAYVSYQDGLGIPPVVQGRLSFGPLWLSGGFTPHRPVDVAGSLHVGMAQLFASPTIGVLTLQPNAYSFVQLAHEWETQRTAARIGFGPTWASPFAFPVTSLHPTPRR